MKTTFLTLTALFVACLSYAQEVESTPSEKSAKQDYSKQDTTRIVVGDTKVLVIPGEDESDTLFCDSETDEVNFHWMGFDVGVNGLMYGGNSFTPGNSHDFLELNYGKSIYMSFNFIEKDISLIENRMRFVTGMGIDWNSYAFERNITLNPHASEISAVTDSVNTYSKNKLRVTSLTVPAMIGFISNQESHKSFRLAAGVVGRYVINTKHKRTYEQDGVTYKPMVKDDFGVNPWGLSATVRAGYSWFNVYASYGLTEFFQKGEGPDARAFNVGVSVLLD